MPETIVTKEEILALKKKYRTHKEIAFALNICPRSWVNWRSGNLKREFQVDSARRSVKELLERENVFSIESSRGRGSTSEPPLFATSAL